MEYLKDLGGDVFSLEEFAKMVKCGAFTDYDGFGQLIYGKEVDPRFIYPSTFFGTDLKNATDIVWFNK